MRQTIPETRSDYDDVSLIERPDGFYWQDKNEGREYGPFASLLAAMEDIDARGGEGEPAASEALAEAESDLGVSEWIDEETGELAEENAPRLEQH
jgi:hypothetical protein